MVEPSPHPSEASLKQRFEALRRREFSRLDEQGYVYLDYTGSALYGASHLRSHERFLRSHVLGNPHSENPASTATTRIVEETRREVLDFFGADPDEFTVVFTGNASSALKLVGESFPFGPGSRLTLLADSHNSVNGIRAYAERAGAETCYLPLDDELRLDRSTAIPEAGEAPSLFSFPAQSNFSGVQHPLALAEEASSLGYTVLLDAAAFVPTNRLDLGATGVDFACVSFYKMFGFPTGIGALIARKEALERLERPWFAGGTVEFVSVEHHMHRLVTGAGAFEDGTPDFLGIAAVRGGLAFLSEVDMDRVHERIGLLTHRLLEIVCGLRHPNGSPGALVYGPRSAESRGGTVSFNLLDAEGAIVPYGEVEQAAGAEKISLRGGCFCNPGAAEKALQLSGPEMRACLESIPRGEFSLERLAQCLGGDAAVGALRASVGIPTTDADLDRLESFLVRYLAR